MKKITKSFLVLTLLLCILLSFAGAAGRETHPEEESILDAIKNARNITGCPSNYMNDGTMTNASKETFYTQKASQNSTLNEEALLTPLNDNLHQYYTEKASEIDSIMSAAKSSLESDIISDTVDGGTQNLEINTLKTVDDNTVITRVSSISWLKCIDEMEGNFVAYTIVNSDTIEYEIKKEDGIWKINNTLDFNKRFAPESFDNGQNTFDTYKEAYDYIMDFTIEMPVSFI